jgi:hypothetical protein
VSLLKDSQIASIEQGKYSRSFTNLSWIFFWWIVLMWIFKKQDLWLRTGFNWLRTATSDSSCELVMQVCGFVKGAYIQSDKQLSASVE